MLGGIYFVAFLSLSNQLTPLFGKDGLLPAKDFLSRVSANGASFWQLPSLFWVNSSDGLMQAAALVGLVLSATVALGLTNAWLMAVLWLLYMSFVHIGQIFYSFGWEILLLESGFLAIFLCPLFTLSPFPAKSPPSVAVIWLFRWVLFRVMFGAGLIKIRGDECWRDLTCLYYHYETQPLPNPLSWLLHQAPGWFHKLGTLFNHFVELIVPWGMFAPRRIAAASGLLMALFQVILILSGNLSWLNWLTLVLCVACFDDSFLRPLFPSSIRNRLSALSSVAYPRRLKIMGWVLVGLVAVLSVQPVLNLVSEYQIMNTSFDRLHLVNTYGAFGHVGRKRYEVILQGTYDNPLAEDAAWSEYEFPCKPGDVMRRPCIIAPYQYRLDWEIWFAAMSDYQHHAWLVHLTAKLLQGDQKALRLLAKNPFTRGPPKFIRAELYEYQFTRLGDSSKAWWRRSRAASYFPPVSADDPSLRSFLQLHGWTE
jgi:hypothetical protein